MRGLTPKFVHSTSTLTRTLAEFPETFKMADPITNGDAEEELVDYDEDEGGEEAKSTTKAGDQAKAGYVGIHSSGFKDFLLKPELLRAIVDCGFEHPSEGRSLTSSILFDMRIELKGL